MALSSDEDAHIYWHRELPPDDAEALGEHVLEATSDHVTGTITHGDEQWRTCYESLMAHVRARFAEEVMRLGRYRTLTVCTDGVRQGLLLRETFDR